MEEGTARLGALSHGSDSRCPLSRGAGNLERRLSGQKGVRSTIIGASLLGTTALVPSASAQNTTETAVSAEICEELCVLNEENAETYNEEFIAGARQVIERADPAVCDLASGSARRYRTK